MNLSELNNDPIAFAKLFLKKDIPKYQRDIIKKIQNCGGKICFASTPYSKDNVFAKYLQPDSEENFYGRGLIGELKKLQEENMTKNPSFVPYGQLTSTILDDLEDRPVKFYQVKIDKVTNGFVIEIGCYKFIAATWDNLAKELAEYWKDPAAAEKKYCK